MKNIFFAMLVICMMSTAAFGLEYDLVTQGVGPVGTNAAAMQGAGKKVNKTDTVQPDGPTTITTGEAEDLTVDLSAITTATYSEPFTVQGNTLIGQTASPVLRVVSSKFITFDLAAIRDEAGYSGYMELTGMVGAHPQGNNPANDTQWVIFVDGVEYFRSQVLKATVDPKSEAITKNAGDAGEFKIEPNARFLTLACCDVDGYDYDWAGVGPLVLSDATGFVFEVSDTDTGSTSYTNDATVAVSITPPDSNVYQYQITETPDEPTTWLETAPTSYTITESQGVVTLYGWYKAEDGTVESASQEIRFSANTPSISNVVATGGVASITVDWETDVDAFGYVKYGVAGQPLDQVTDFTAYGISHQVVINNLLDETLYELEIHSNGVSEPAAASTLAAVPTSGDVTWSGNAAGDTSWSTSANWEGTEPPAESAGVVTFLNAGAVDDDSVTNSIGMDRTVAGLAVNNAGTAGAHKTDLGGFTLTVNGTAEFGYEVLTGPVTFTNGTLQVGTADAAQDLYVGYRNSHGTPKGEATLVMDGATLDANLNSCYVGWCGDMHQGSTGTLDLQNGTLANGTFQTRNLYVGSRGNKGHIYFSDTTGLTSFIVTQEARMAREGEFRIGDPNNEYKLPANVNITFGEQGVTRCNIKAGVPEYSDGTSNAQLIASGGGMLFAYLGTVELGYQSCGWNGGVGRGILDFSAMDNVILDAETVKMSTAPKNTSNNQQGKLYLPAGTATIQNLQMGSDAIADNSVSELKLFGTDCTVSNTLFMGNNSLIEVNVDGFSCGLRIPAGVRPEVLGTITVNFLSDSTMGGAYYGLFWEGNHEAELFALRDAGKLVIDDTAIEGKTGGILYDPGVDATYVTVQETWGLTALAKNLRYEVFNESTIIEITVDEIDGGSFDFAGNDIVARSISCPSDLDPDSPNVTLSGTGDYQVTLLVENSIGETDMATSTVTLFTPPVVTEGELTFTNEAELGPEWTRQMNWDEEVVPANPSTVSINYTNKGVVTDGSITSLVNPLDFIGASDTWQVSGIHFRNMEVGGHNIQIADNSTLVIANELRAFYEAEWLANKTGLTASISGGTLQLGTPEQSANLDVVVLENNWWGLEGQLVISAQQFIPYLDTVKVGYHGRPYQNRFAKARLDLRNTTIAGGSLDLQNLYIGHGAAGPAELLVSDITGLTSLSIANEFEMGWLGNDAYLGNPDGGDILPAGIAVKLGVDEATRGSFKMASVSQYNMSDFVNGTGRFIAGNGGTFDAYLSEMTIGYSDVDSPSAVATANVDLSTMDQVYLDVTNLNVGNAADTAPAARYNSTVKLAAGTAIVDTLRMGVGGDAESTALLELNATKMTVATEATVGANGNFTIYAGSESGGLDIPAAATLTVDGAINVIFENQPTVSGVMWAIRWEGDHAADLQALVASGNLVLDDSAIPEVAEISFDGTYTYAGLAGGTTRVVDFTLSDLTTGSKKVTDAAEVTVNIVGEAAEGQTITGYQITTSDVEPVDGWSEFAPVDYTIPSEVLVPSNTVTLYGWVKDSAGTTAVRAGSIYYEPLVANVSGLTITETGPTTLQVEWSTDVAAFGELKYRLQGETDWAAIEEDMPMLLHTMTIDNFDPEATYELVVVNNGVEEAPILYPEPAQTWPVEGDANLDCKVNIIDLIFVRNRLNGDVASDDNWQADVNSDGKINIIDLIYIRNRLNSKCPE